MAFPIKVCAVCSEEFELKPDKPGFANRCPTCSEPEHIDPKTNQAMDAIGRNAQIEEKRCATSSTARIAKGFPQRASPLQFAQDSQLVKLFITITRFRA